ncbi:MAG: hypothetical protein U1E91_05190 [Moraxella sp.]
MIIIALFYTRLGKDTTVVTNTSLNRALPSLAYRLWVIHHK